MKITERVHQIPGVVANPYLLIDNDVLTLVDAGMPRSEKKILAYIVSLGKRPENLRRIILTHSDLDHVGSLAALVRATGARTYASQIEAQAIAKGRPSRAIQPKGFSTRRILFTLMRPFFKPTAVRIDEIIKDGQSLPILGTLQVLDTAGHTPGHISLYAPEEHVLFCGDSIVSDGGLLPSRPGLTWNQAAATAAVKKQAELAAEIVCSGHGPVVMQARGKFPQV
jgi:glyoxylase-like metal-dependent hydrolase (beta-lactamase superfamily II)